MSSGEVDHCCSDANRTTVAAASRYFYRGWMPVPVPAGAKGPVIKSWQRLRFAEAELAEHFAGPGNLGLILGEPSGWLVDVDLDCDDARALADTYLPPTPAVTGRASASPSGSVPVICTTAVSGSAPRNRRGWRGARSAELTGPAGSVASRGATRSGMAARSRRPCRRLGQFVTPRRTHNDGGRSSPGNRPDAHDRPWMSSRSARPPAT